MQIKEYLNNVCEQIKFKPIRNEISEELKNHIEEMKENYIQEGLDEKGAEEKAIKHMGSSEQIGKELNKIHKPKFDWKLLVIIIVLLCFGLLVSFVREDSIDKGLFGAEGKSITKFIMFVITGTIIGVAIYFVDYTKIKKYSNLIYILATISILFAVLGGVLKNGTLHIRLGTITFSPTVVAVPLYIIAFVGFINDLNKKSKLQMKILDSNINIKINLILIKVIILSIISLIILNLIPSMTSAFILGLTYLILGTVKILEIKENRVKNIFKLYSIPLFIGVFIIVMMNGNEMFAHRINRFIVAFNPESDPTGGGWLGINRKMIIETAQTWGEAGNVSDAISLFDEGTNYAFISILAHYGWIVSTMIVATILLLSIKLIVNAIKIKETYGKLLIIGISSMFILQSIFNILLNLNLWIDADFNLPFVSYGGANLVINIMSLALILSVYRRKNLVILKATEKQAV